MTFWKQIEETILLYIKIFVQHNDGSRYCSNKPISISITNVVSLITIASIKISSIMFEIILGALIAPVVTSIAI